ncbi:MAG: hypothetical protein AAGA92_04490 [Planctomycetota bacterium]
MFSDEEQQKITETTRTTQIIVAALAAGVFSYLCFVLISSDGEKAEDSDLLYESLTVAAAALLAQPFLPGLITRSGIKSIAQGAAEPEDQVRQICELYTTKTIVGAAPLEGAAFFSIFNYSMSGNGVSLAVAAALLVAFFFHFPIATTVSDWVEKQTRAVEELRSSI